MKFVDRENEFDVDQASNPIERVAFFSRQDRVRYARRASFLTILTVLSGAAILLLAGRTDRQPSRTLHRRHPL